MRYLILSDLHANLEALRAVIDEAPPSGFDGVLVLGDLVGYGASPNDVVETIRGLHRNLHVIRGNHDKAACGLDDAVSFHQVARTAAKWTARTLTAGNRDYLEQLPQGPVTIDEGISICHGSPRDEDEYLLSESVADEVLGLQSNPVAFFGHTHLPTIFVRRRTELQSVLPVPDATQLELDPEALQLLNPGAVGQPRDQDARAAFMTYDSVRRRAVWRRVDYPLAEAQRRILAAGLPPILAQRLANGV